LAGNLLVKTSVAIIKKYQSLGGGENIFAVDCNFTTSCSHYSVEALEKYGFIKG